MDTCWVLTYKKNLVRTCKWTLVWYLQTERILSGHVNGHLLGTVLTYKKNLVRTCKWTLVGYLHTKRILSGHVNGHLLGTYKGKESCQDM